MISSTRLSTGLPGLDGVFQGLLEGDNLVWRVDSIAMYAPFVTAFAANALKQGRRVVYFRFAAHAPLLTGEEGVEIHELQPAHGFEIFVAEIHRIVISGGRETVYVFDCLSELAADWCSDRMLGNFYVLICPYVYDHGGCAYFSLLRDCHSFHATDPVRRTTQILVDVYRHEERLCVYPRKVQYRYANAMYTLHVQEGGRFCPVTDSATVAEVFADTRWRRMDSETWRLGYWSSIFARAEDVEAALQRGEDPGEDIETLTQQLRRMLIARQGPMLALAEQHLDLSDLLAVRRHMIGTGLIGGKSAGLVLSRAVLGKQSDKWKTLLEPSDSFFIGADVFYTFLVQNGLWWIKRRQKDPDNYLDGLPLARHQILDGRFPEYITQQFSDLLSYFGQSPIIVRSSSLLEDDFDSSFAGKGESVLCANQGTLHRRMAELMMAIRRVYASNMSGEALKYRSARGLLGEDEQMAVLIQRVSGMTYGRRHFPHLAGVGLSFNPYAWDPRIDREAGVLRLVFGLGTRAVGVNQNEFTRIVALNAPELELHDPGDGDVPVTQQYVDLLDLDSGRITSPLFTDLVKEGLELPLAYVAREDPRLRRMAREQGRGSICAWVLNFQGLFRNTDFAERMRELLSCLGEAYGGPVDVEFAVGMDRSGNYRINLLQCRPFVGEGPEDGSTEAVEVPRERCIVRSAGPVIGRSRSFDVDRVIYVIPEIYGKLPMKDRYAVARLVGALMQVARKADGHTILLGPGRWGTGSPSLGVPTSFADLHGAAALCEIATMHEGLIPDLSLGSHFFHELVETGLLYFAVYPDQEGCRIDKEFFRNAPNQLPKLMPGERALANVVTVVEPALLPTPARLRVLANTRQQVVAIALDHAPDVPGNEI